MLSDEDSSAVSQLCFPDLSTSTPTYASFAFLGRVVLWGLMPGKAHQGILEVQVGLERC